jgi:hypothetical protein
MVVNISILKQLVEIFFFPDVVIALKHGNEKALAKAAGAQTNELFPDSFQNFDVFCFVHKKVFVVQYNAFIVAQLIRHFHNVLLLWFWRNLSSEKTRLSGVAFPPANYNADRRYWKSLNSFCAPPA